jgi:hypothetical protein
MIPKDLYKSTPGLTFPSPDVPITGLPDLLVLAVGDSGDGLPSLYIPHHSRPSQIGVGFVRCTPAVRQKIYPTRVILVPHRRRPVLFHPRSFESIRAVCTPLLCVLCVLCGKKISVLI